MSAHDRGMATVEMNVRYLKGLGAVELAAGMRVTAEHLNREAHRAVPFPGEIAARARDHLVDDPET